MKALTIVIIIVVVLVCLIVAGVLIDKYAIKKTGSSYTTPAAGSTSGSGAGSSTPAAVSNVPPSALVGGVVYDLGSYSMAPWGSASNFIDPKAQWIWNSQAAATSAPKGTVIFENQYYNSGSTNISAVLHIEVDDSAVVNLNGNNLGSASAGYGGGYTQISCQLIPGNNLFKVAATNTGGPAGVLLSLINTQTNTVLLRSDNTWVTSTS